MIKTFKISSEQPAVETHQSVNRNFVIDCSGSMSSDLPAIRKSLKNKVPQLTNVGDTVTITWFSGRNEAGILLDSMEINSVADFANMNNVIDKWLKPVCLTGFVDPLKLATEWASRMKSQNGNNNYVIFQTDGYDNQWSEKEIMNALIDLSAVIDTITFVEYGWYANRQLLSKMAEEIGGHHIFAESFDQFDNIIEKSLSKVVKGGKKKIVEIPEVAKFGAVYSFDEDGNISNFIVQDGKVSVPESVTEVQYFTESDVVELDDETSIYKGIYFLSQRMLSGEVMNLLGKLGDKALIDMFINCFTKQDYTAFTDHVLACIVDASKRYVNGKDTNYLPKEDAFTVVDLLELLSNDADAKFYPYHESFKYERMGVKQEQVEEEGKHVAKFTPAKIGYRIDELVYNENRPNINIRVKINGTVNLPKNGLGIPQDFPTHVYRNYNVIRDGIKHTSCKNLPFSMSHVTFAILQANGLLEGETWEADKVFTINANIPVVNRLMTRDVSAKRFFENVAELIRLKSVQKVLNTKYKAKFTKTSAGIADAYGKDGEEWLKSFGITSMGFNPKTEKGEVQDTYVARYFSVKVAGCSSIPPINEKLEAKIASGKSLTISEVLCKDAILEYNELGDLLEEGFSRQLKEHLENAMKANKALIAEVSKEIIKDKFAIIAGKTWFSEFASLEENSMTVELDGVRFDCQAILEEKEVEC